MDKDISQNRNNIVANLLQVKKEEFLIYYLGCPLFAGKKLNQYFADMASKIIKGVGAWHYNKLSAGGKIIFIKHVLNAMFVHLLSVCQPTETILKQMDSIFASFFWGSKEGKQKYHWASWNSMCFPMEEGVLVSGPSTIFQKVLLSSYGGNLEPKDSMWTRFMKAKYSKRIHPVSRK